MASISFLWLLWHFCHSVLCSFKTRYPLAGCVKLKFLKLFAVKLPKLNGSRTNYSRAYFGLWPLTQE